jgi:hypothetical protein
MSPLRFGVLCGRDGLLAWQAACVERLVASGLAEPALIARDTGAEPRARPSLARLYLDSWVAPRSRALAPAGAASLLGVPTIECAGLGPGEVARVRDHRLDFILRFGFAEVGGLLRAARHGVWAYDHAAAELPCFDGLARGAPRTEVVLRRLTGEAEGVPLHRGWFGTCRASWVNTLDRACFGAAGWCARVCAEIAAGRTDRLAQPTEPLGASPPVSAALARFALAAGSHLARRSWELLLHDEVWNVGVTPETVEEIVSRGGIDGRRVAWCKPHKRGCFVADPFAFSDAGQERVIAEEWDETGKGRIVSLDPPYQPDQLSTRVEIEHAYHMSYPCVLRDGGETYCVPETYQSRRVSLYRRVERRWRLERTLLEGQPFVDPSLFRHGDLYWLFVTLQDDGAHGNQALHAYHAEALRGPWRPHALNPIKSDIGSSRPAGSPISIGGELYRPGQDCSETYGGALVLHRITQLSPTSFEEVAAVRIEPDRSGPYPDGLHTLNRMERGTVIDGKKFTFHPLAWRQNWRRLHELFT